MGEVKGILSDLRVLDLSTCAAGQLAARWLAEFGAETVRLIIPVSDADEQTTGWTVRNRSKKLVFLDDISGRGRDQLRRMLAGADVLIYDRISEETLSQAVDLCSLSERFPQLVHCSISAFPGDGPDADLPAVDSLVLARAGMLDEFMGLSRTEGPIYMRVPFATLGAARLSVIAILARLIARRRDGVGGQARTSLFQGALASMSCLWARGEDTSFHSMSRTISRHSPASGGFGNPRYQCADGQWMQIVGVPDFLPLMADVLGELGEEVPTAPEGVRGASFGFAGLSEDVKARAFARRPRRMWLEALWAGDVPAFPCLELGEIYADEQARVNGFSIRVDDPKRGASWQPGVPCRAHPPSEVTGPAPSSPASCPDWTARSTLEPKVGPRLPPLHGMRVLDLGQFIAGPYAASIFADLGADVVKVEPPKGDGLRPPAKGLFRPAKSFAAGNRGKRTIALDLKDPEARPLVNALVEWADVIMHNVRQAAVCRLGLDYDTLSASRPDLVYCHLDAYGSAGPRSDWPGFDPLAQAASGWQMASAGTGNPPLWMRNAYMDYHCGLAAAAAALLAIYARQQTGKGQLCGASLLGECLQSIGEVTMDDEGRISDVGELDSDQTGVSPYDRLYRCEDGRWLALLARTADERAALLSAFEADTPQALESAIGQWPREYALTLLREAGVPAAEARQDQMDAFLNSGTSLVTSYVSKDWGRLHQVGALWEFGDLPLSLDRAPPALGEHSVEICDELGIDPGLVRHLLESGAVHDWLRARTPNGTAAPAAAERNAS